MTAPAPASGWARGSLGPRRGALVVAVALLLTAAVFIVLAQSPSAPGTLTPSGARVDQAAATKIATDFVAQGLGSDARLLGVAVERVEDHGSFWRVTLHADAAYPVLVTAPAVRTMQSMRFHYQIDVDKRTATPSIYAQG
jgi:hypothetical protein